MSPYAVISAETPIASYIGTKILEQGGNFADASVATSLALAITIPHLGGLGGDFFALFRTSDGRVHFINGSGYAPKELSVDLMIERGFMKMPSTGPLSIVVPGMIDALYLLLENFGTMEWSIVVREVIDRLKRGFPMGISLAKTLLNIKEELARDEGSYRTYYSQLTKISPAEVVKFKGMIKALEVLREDPRAFYEGDIAEKICEYVQSLGGVLDISDMKEYHAFFDDPIKLSLENTTVFEMPPNTQGVTTLQVIKMLESANLGGPLSAKRIKESLRAFRAAYWIRDQYISDPRDMRVSVRELLSDEFLEKALSESGKSLSNHTNGGDTTYFAIADDDGNVISAVQSLFYPFGSRVTEPTYGITLNARASSFSLNRDHVNVLKPRKRPLHTLSAMIIEDDSRVMALGLSGGHYRPQLHSEIFSNIYKYSLGVQDALDHRRFIWHLWTSSVDMEDGFQTASLKGLDINVVPYPSRLGVAGAVEILMNGIRVGYCDIRGEGIPIGLI